MKKYTCKPFLLLLICLSLAACDFFDKNSIQGELNAFSPSVSAPEKVISGHTVHLLANSGSSEYTPVWSWTQTGGLTVQLKDEGSGSVSFVAPMVSSPTVLSFEVVARAGKASATLEVSVSVQPDSVATSAGEDILAHGGNRISLHAEASTTSGGNVSYDWQQTAGPQVSLTSANSANPSFIAPQISSELSFEVIATDSVGVSASDTVVVRVVNANPPLIYAQKNSIGFSGQVQTLEVSPDDPNQGSLDYQWLQVAGPDVTLSSNSTQQVSFVTPMVSQVTLIEFRVRAVNSNNLAGVTYVSAVAYPKSGSQPLIIDAGRDRNALTEDNLQLSVTVLQQGKGNLTYQWQQISGPQAVITQDTAQQALATLAATPGQAVFEVEVSDGVTTVRDQIKIQTEELSVRISALDSQVNIRNTANVGTPLHLHASVDHAQAPVSYQWRQISGPTATLVDPQNHDMNLTPSSPGDVLYEVEVVDALGRSASSRIALSIVAASAPVAPSPPVVPADQLTIHVSPGSTKASNPTFEGDNIKATVSFSGEAASPTINWQEVSSSGLTLTDSNQATVQFTALAVNKDKPVTLVVTVDDGVTQRSDQVSFLIQDRPISITPAADIVSYTGKDQTLSARVSGGLPPLSYQWTQTTGQSVAITDDTRPIAAFTPSVKDQYAFTLTVSDGLGNSKIAVVRADIDEVPPAPSGVSQQMAILTPPPLTFLEGQSVSMNVAIENAKGTPTIAWSVVNDGGTSLTNADLTDRDLNLVSFTTPLVTQDTTVTLQVAVTDNDGTLTRSLNVPVGNRDISVQALPRSLTIGLSHTAHLHANVTAPNALQPIDWSWLETYGATGNLVNVNSANPSFVAPASGQYTFDATAEDQLGNSDTDTVSLTANDDLSVTVDNATTGIKADFPSAYGEGKISLHGGATKGSGSYTYQWSLEAYQPSTKAWEPQNKATGTFPVEFVGNANEENVTVQLVQDTFKVPVGNVYCEKSLSSCRKVQARATLTVVDNADQHAESQTVAFTWEKPAQAAKIPASPAGQSCNAVISASATGNESYQAYHCDGPPEVCEDLNYELPCPPGTIPAVEVTNHLNADREVAMGCMAVTGDGSINTGGLPQDTNCRDSWFQRYSTADKCINFQFEYIYTSDFYCVICTVGDRSNYSGKGCATPGPRWSP